MKKHCGIGLVMFALVGCASTLYPTINTDYTNEQWRSQVETNPNAWTTKADAWFLNGDPTVTDNQDVSASEAAAMTTMQVKVPTFTDIKTNGSFKVQIFGTHERNSVYIYGPNAKARMVSVQVRGDRLCVDQGDQLKANLSDVIVRIGVQDLGRLTHQGSGTVEGLSVRSTGLMVDSNATGDIILSGDMNLRKLIAQGNGSVTVLGANAPVVDVIMTGRGSVNLSGNVGIHDVNHKGFGDFNVIGANSDSVSVYAQGVGKLGFSGNFDIKQVQAHYSTCILMQTSNSQSIYAYAYDKAKIGMAGWTKNLTVYTSDNAKFLGRYLQSDNAYVRASDASHINVSAKIRVFAAATDSASVYFFGEPSLLSQFVSGRGTVIPIWENRSRDAIQKTNPQPSSFAPHAAYKDDPSAVRYRWVHGQLKAFPAS